MNLVVLGAGAWGTAIAVHLQRQGHITTLVPRRVEQALDLAHARENRDRLPGVKLPDGLQIGFELKPVLMEAELTLLAAPSVHLRELCTQIEAVRASSWNLQGAVALCKGLDPETGQRPSEIIAECLPGLAVGNMTGPTHAREVALGRPAAMTLAATGDWIESWQVALSGGSVRVYRSDDLPGVEWGATLKNTYAIAAGIASGLDLGDNARAALLTRALAEMVRLGVALGGQRETFYGLSGLGDLMATAMGDWSRNRNFGYALGQGRSAEEALNAAAGVVEGYRTTQTAQRLARKAKVDTPILDELYAIQFEGRPAAEALLQLLSRDLKAEER